MRSCRSCVLLLLAAALALAFTAEPAYGTGTICGTVRDAVTAAPVAGAGIFVFTPAGAYTGFHAATDAAGAFCISGIPAGTYDLQVRRDHYVTTYARGVEVTEDVTGVDVGVMSLAATLLPPAPNPAHGRIQFRFQLRDPAPVRLEVLDAQGRLLKGWSQTAAAAGEHALTWDFRDFAGRTLPAGRYFVRLRIASAKFTRAFARVP